VYGNYGAIVTSAVKRIKAVRRTRAKKNVKRYDRTYKNLGGGSFRAKKAEFGCEIHGEP